ncbi:MAG: energy transducer TonB [Acidobacteriota bacterium]|nr:energy transducer TonB [Acidobacteriota bacterium]
MQLRRVSLLLIAACAASAQDPNPQGTISKVPSRISFAPTLSSGEAAELENRLFAEPADIAGRMRLLTYYNELAATQGSPNSTYRAARLRHILYLIENRPEDPTAASPLAYVYDSNGPYADAGDHELAKGAWMRAVDTHPGSPEIQLNAARFLFVEHPEAAEDLVNHALAREPSNRGTAANLGFLYAMDILGLASPFGSRVCSLSERERLWARARTELDRTNHPFVLANAATALNNLFMRSDAARAPNGDRPIFEYGSILMRRARQVGAGETELNGPMPLIREFQKFNNPATLPQNNASPPVGSIGGALGGLPTLSPAEGSGIRVPSNVQAAKLIEKPDPVYPELARQARIQGTVRFNVVVAGDGSIEHMTLVSGHPLLVSAARDALLRYRYLPTLLNGSPMKVVTEVDVSFLLNSR